MPVIIREESPPDDLLTEFMEDTPENNQKITQMSRNVKIKIAKPTDNVYTYFLNVYSKKIDICLEPRDIREHINNKKYKLITKEQYESCIKHQRYFKEIFKTLCGTYKDQSIHILGNGPSLKDNIPRFKFHEVLTIGVNAAPIAFPDLNYWIVIDELKNDTRSLWSILYKWWKYNNKSVCVFNSSAVDVMEEELIPDYMFDRQSGINNDGLYWYGSSVHAAIDLAIKMGANNIYLWGIDYTDRSHFYTGSKLINSDNLDRPNESWSDYEKHCQGFTLLKQYADKHKVKIINCNPKSKLSIFPKVNPVDEFPNLVQNVGKEWSVDDTVVKYEYENPDGDILHETVNNTPIPELEPQVHEELECSAKFDFVTNTIILKNLNGIQVLRIDEVKKDKSINVILNGYKKLKGLVEKVGYNQT